MRQPASDLATLVLAVVIAALARVDGAAGLVLAYAGAWALVNAARVAGWPPQAAAIPRLHLALGVALVLVVPARDLLARWRTIVEHEGLGDPLEHLGDRLALDADPAIAPRLVSADRPQTFFVRASGAHVRVRLGPRVEWIDAEGMGHGVFRVDYDPRSAGPPPPRVSRATIEVDGIAHERTLLAATPAAHPRWLRTSPDRTHACVPSEETDEVVVLSVGGEPERIGTLDGPTDCAIYDDGSLFVVHRFARRVLHLDAARRRQTADAGGPGATALAELEGQPCHAREGPDAEVRCSGPSPARLSIEGSPLFLAGVPGQAALILATRSPAALVRIERAGGTLVARASRALAMPAAHLAVDPSGARVVVALGDLDEDGAPRLGNHFAQDRLASFDTATLALVEDRLTAFRTDRQDHAGDVDRGASPMGIAFAADGRLLVAFAGTDEIEEIGGAAPRVVDTAALGVSAPFSAVELADGSRVITSPSSALVVVLDVRGAPSRTIALAARDRELLATDPSALQLRFGERAFYEATRSGVSCQSCHLHGGTDGAAHNIGGRVLAPTLDVRGLTGTSPYLRDGSYPRLRDLHEVAVTEYRGYRESAGDRGANVEAWLETLPPPPTFVAREAALEREGLDVFFGAGCPDCHAPPAFTSLGLHAIDAVFPEEHGEADARLLDVPSLRSVAASAPYLYDGRASTLASLLAEHNSADRHGHTRGLDEHARRALVAFLRSL